MGYTHQYVPELVLKCDAGAMAGEREAALNQAWQGMAPNLRETADPDPVAVPLNPAYPAGPRYSVARGGRVRYSACASPCIWCGIVVTPPALPILLPP